MTTEGLPAIAKLALRLSLLAVTAVALARPGSARAAPAAVPRTQLVDVPCSGCRASFPAGSESVAVPLLVILHGDSGYGPGDLLRAWERHATSRGIALIALQCPRDLGCKGSWWQWNGDPSWISAQVDALAGKRPIDRERTWLAGWSGGASYIGLRAQAFQRSFAALVYHGGGIAPSGPCASGMAPTSKAAPVHFLVGTANPLHHLAIKLRQHHDACAEDVVWRALPGADHPAEWRALDTHGGTVMDWLLRQRSPQPKPQP